MFVAMLTYKCFVYFLFFFFVYTRLKSIPAAKIELAFFLCVFKYFFLSTADDFFTFWKISAFESDSLGRKDRCGSITRSKSFLRTENISQYVRARTTFSCFWKKQTKIKMRTEKQNTKQIKTKIWKKKWRFKFFFVCFTLQCFPTVEMCPHQRIHQYK